MECMARGEGHVEILERIENVSDKHEVVERDALGNRDLVWVRINVSSFYRSGAGFHIQEMGEIGTIWLHEANVRNFTRVDG